MFPLLLAVVVFAGAPDLSITPETALQHYLQNNDPSFSWTIRDSLDMNGVKRYDILLTSQKWRQYTWQHQLTVLVPPGVAYDGALLFITGGHLENGRPEMTGRDDGLAQTLGNMARRNKAVTAYLRQVPNQPLYGDLTEDALISYTLHNFKKDGDYTWPLLFPMVKSAVKAMDALQAFAREKKLPDLNRFVVSGASKRGWTTWLTGASDKRVAAIAPMVIDVLNMPVNLEYQIKVWHEYSPQIEDYVKLEIPQQVHSPAGEQLTKMVDPYSYRRLLTMPKMIFMGTNDEYWPVDAVKHYIDSIPGENYIHYVPNAGHDLGDGVQAFRALSAFFSFTLQKRPYPVCKWQIAEKDQGIRLSAQASPGQLLDAVLWTSESKDQDFRDEQWKGTSLHAKGNAEVKADTRFPASGYKAFYLDLKYRDINGDEYTESTRMFVADEDEVFVR